LTHDATFSGNIESIIHPTAVALAVWHHRADSYWKR